MLGIVVVDYHSYDQLYGFVHSLIDADPQIPYFLIMEIVEAKGMESIEAGELADLFANRSMSAAVCSHRNNVGYNVAVNDGVKWLSSLPVDIDKMTVAFFNSDTRLYSGVLESCVDLLWSDDSFGAVGPRQVNEQGKLTSAGIFGTLKQPRHRGWMEVAGEKYKDVRDDCVTVAGSAYFIRMKTWNEMDSCSLYREIDPLSDGALLTCNHYYGETYLSYHLHAHDYKIIYNGEVTMDHYWHKASPVGGFAEINLKDDQAFFRKACDHHQNEKFSEGIPHD